MIRHWVVLDLDVFRRHEDDPLVRKEIQDNHDGTHFIAYDIRSFPSQLIIGMSPTMATALEHGVDAVKPLQPKQQSDFSDWLRENPPPDLQALAAQYGGLGNVPQQAWARFDRDREGWLANYRERAVGQKSLPMVKHRAVR